MLLRETAAPQLKERRADWGLIDFGSYVDFGSLPVLGRAIASCSNHNSVGVEMEDIIELTIMDISISDTKSTLAVIEYVVDLFAHYRKMGAKTLNL
ncbi:hypothetical protein L1987_01679 [Smallanthus sonchifolius]|uniref:Uncharacterized protein n=1 Tax=Smallanthus sonchifolius TaxID=185202 RepID=A0ACB9K5Q1_9ASTR|nr:hypothetical protein L1987_01679 [Smallanthus sonchifolius]